MKISRRKFIKTTFWGFLSTMFLPAFVESEKITASHVKLNYKPNPSEWKSDQLTIAWIGHSTILMNLFGKWILTDPVLMNRIGLYFFGTSIGPTRITPPALNFKEMPKPDIILLSHAHMDHMDYPTLRMLSEMYPNEIDIITAFLTADVIGDLKWKSINIICHTTFPLLLQFYSLDFLLS